MIIVSPDLMRRLEELFASIKRSLDDVFGGSTAYARRVPLDEEDVPASRPLLYGRGPAAPAELRGVDLRIEHSRPSRCEAREHRQSLRRPHARGWGNR